MYILDTTEKQTATAKTLLITSEKRCSECSDFSSGFDTLDEMVVEGEQRIATARAGTLLFIVALIIGIASAAFYELMLASNLVYDRVAQVQAEVESTENK